MSRLFFCCGVLFFLFLWGGGCSFFLCWFLGWGGVLVRRAWHQKVHNFWISLDSLGVGTELAVNHLFTRFTLQPFQAKSRDGTGLGFRVFRFRTHSKGPALKQVSTPTSTTKRKRNVCAFQLCVDTDAYTPFNCTRDLVGCQKEAWRSVDHQTIQALNENHLLH